MRHPETLRWGKLTKKEDAGKKIKRAAHFQSFGVIKHSWMSSFSATSNLAVANML